MPESGTALSRFPESERERGILRRRAVRLAGEGRRARAEQGCDLFLAVRLGRGERYGIPYAQVQEIVRPRSLTPVPCTPPSVAGVFQRHGQLLAALSLRALLPMAGREEGGDEAWVVIVGAAGMTVGLLVDGIEGNEHWAPAALTPAPPSPSVRDPAWIAGIHDGRVAMLNLDALLASLSMEEKT